MRGERSTEGSKRERRGFPGEKSSGPVGHFLNSARVASVVPRPGVFRTKSSGPQSTSGGFVSHPKELAQGRKKATV